MEVGDLITVTVSQWNFNKEFYAAAIPDFTNNRLMSLLENNLPSLKSDNVFKKYWGYINTFFRTQGFYQPNIYKFTSAFCNALMHNSRIMRENIDGILYTSLQDTSGWNLAISSKFVDENLELKRVFKILLRKQGYSNGKPVYDNFLTPEPIFPKLLDISSQKIIWE